MIEVAVDAIERPDAQPREDFDEGALDELADSIRQSGLLQPLVVRPTGETYELIAGERRLRASHRAGLEEVPAVVQRVTGDEAYALALVENIQREDLNPIEEARAYRRLMNECDYTQEELADQLGTSRSTIANAVRLLTLPDPVQGMLAAGRIAAGHARALTPLPDDEAEELAEQIEREDLSVRDAESLVQSRHTSGGSDDDSEGDSSYRQDAQARRVVDDLQRELGTKVELKDRHGEGRVEIHYDNYEVLQGVLDRIL